jgi:hypothetical protein
VSGSASWSPATDRAVSNAGQEAGVLTILTEKEPVRQFALEVLERGITHKVAVLTVLQWAEGPAGTVQGVVLHGKNVVTQQTINNRSYNYSPNCSIFPEVIRDTFVSHDLGAKVVTFAYVRWGK